MWPSIDLSGHGAQVNAVYKAFNAALRPFIKQEHRPVRHCTAHVPTKLMETARLR
jgi:hypothetical protein